MGFKEVVEKFPDELREPVLSLIDIFSQEYAVKREELNRINIVLERLADAQVKTEERLDRLTDRVDQLAVRMEQLAARMDQLTERMDQLAARMDQLTERMDQLAARMDQLTERMDQLAARMDQLTERMEQLAARMDQLTERMEQLAIAQTKTEEKLSRLTETVVDMKKELGGLSHSVGYNLENQAYKALPELLKERYGIKVEGSLIREYLVLPDGSEEEINIFGKGKEDGREVYIIGEAKTNLTEKDISNFKKKVKKIDRIIGGQKFLMFVAHTVRPKVKKKIEEEKIPVFLSYEF